MIIKPLPNIYQIKGYANSYVIEFEKELIIIDTGMDKKAKELLEAIEKTGKEPKAVLLTHGHLDHTNGLAKIKEKYPETKVIASEEDKPAVEGKVMLLPKGIKGFFFRLMMPFMRYKGVKVDETFKDEWNGFKVIKTPGHTKGSVSLLLELKGKKILFCGDLILNVKNKLSLPPDEFNLNREEMIESIGKISKVDFDCLLSGHGEAITKDAKEKVKEFLENLKL